MTGPLDGSQSELPVRQAGPRCGVTLDEWPHCPACGAARSTRCPACRTEGASWERAFGPPPARFSQRDANGPAEDLAADGVLSTRSMAVICPTCDEVFEPVFARRCANCRHESAVEDAAATHLGRYLSDEGTVTNARRSTRHTLRIILAVITAAAVAYTLYDWLISNSGGARLF